MAELPRGWVVAALDDVALINPKHPPKTKSDTMVSFVPMQAVSESGWRFLRTEERRYSDVRKGYTHFADGDVLLAKITPCFENGKAAIARGLRNGLGCGTTELHVMRPLDGLKAEYLYHYLHQESFRHGAVPNMTGTAGQLRVPVSYIEQVRLPLPPSPEQRRIVAKLEELLGTVDAAHKRLERIPLILKQFRQSVLAAACSGRLTEDWRKKHSAKPPAVEAVELRDSLDIELPASWAEVNLGVLLGSLKYGTARRCDYSKKASPVLRIPNVQNGVVDCSDLKYAAFPKSELRELALEVGDILMVRSNGSVSLVGRVAVVGEGESGYAYAGYLMRLRPNRDLVDHRYLALALRLPSTRTQIEVPARSTSGVHNINSTEVKSLVLPLPPKEEQAEIVRRVESLFKLADQIECRYDAAKASVDQLTQSILAKAFRGGLVPQDPKDKPASKLLERIRASGSHSLEAARA